MSTIRIAAYTVLICTAASYVQAQSFEMRNGLPVKETYSVQPTGGIPAKMDNHFALKGNGWHDVATTNGLRLQFLVRRGHASSYRVLDRRNSEMSRGEIAQGGGQIFEEGKHATEFLRKDDSDTTEKSPNTVCFGYYMLECADFFKPVKSPLGPGFKKERRCWWQKYYICVVKS